MMVQNLEIHFKYSLIFGLNFQNNIKNNSFFYHSLNFLIIGKLR